jgi:hypothetical protein
MSMAVAASQTTAHNPVGGGAKMDMGGPRQTITGEVVDMGCYLGHASRGDKHVACATKCLNSGMPMGLLTNDNRLYLLTLNHDNPDPYNKLKAMAGRTVAVTGAAMDRSGMKAIDVSDFKRVAVRASK